MSQNPEKDDEEKRDDILRRMLKMPPKPHKPGKDKPDEKPKSNDS